MEKKLLITGRIITAVPVLFLLFDAAIKLMNIVPVRESFAKLGWPSDIGVGIGILELGCVVAYLVPRSSALGAVLMTGYLGGAVATHLRVGDPLVSHVFFPLYVGLLLWLGLILRDDRLRAFVFLRTAASR
jgi:hypothetical protein